MILHSTINRKNPLNNNANHPLPFSFAVLLMQYLSVHIKVERTYHSGVAALPIAYDLTQAVSIKNHKQNSGSAYEEMIKAWQIHIL